MRYDSDRVDGKTEGVLLCLCLFRL